MLPRFAHDPDTIRIGDRTVRRLGFGAMRLPGADAWGEPEDPATAHAVLKRAVELGVNFIDTAWYYGPRVANRLIREALHPYPSDVVVATKVGVMRADDKSWHPALRPEQLRVAIEDDLRTLGLDRLPLVHLRWFPQNDVSLLAAVEVLVAAQSEGKLEHIGLSNVGVAELEQACAVTPIASVQSLFSVGANDPDTEALLAACERRGIPFIPYAAPGQASADTINDAIAKRVRSKPVQVAIAWLLRRSPVILPIPGTNKVTHLEENIGGLRVALDDVTFAELAA